MLNRKKLKRAIITFMICSGNYQGNVTLQFLLTEVAWHSGIYRTLPSRESVGLLHEICVAVTPHSICTIPYKICTKKSEILFEPVQPVIFNPLMQPPAFEAAIVQQISGLECTRRLIQPSLADRSLSDIASIHQTEIPPVINLLFGWEPIQHDKYQSDLSIALEMYDSDGELVDVMAKSFFGISWRKEVCDSRVLAENKDEFKMDLPMFKREFFRDQFNVSISLAELPPQVYSVSFVAYNRHTSDPVHKFRRTFVRIVDSLTKMELELFHYRIEQESAYKDACLIGGLYFGQSGWMFAPVVKLFSLQDGFDHLHKRAQDVWMQELANRRLVSLE
jgi:hypothetical protein